MWVRTITFLLLALGTSLAAEWSSWRGPSGDGTFPVKGIKPFPEEGLERVWKARIGPGYSGVTVANGRVYTMDLEEADEKKTERIICLNEGDGGTLWSASYKVDYGDLSYGKGPRSMPTVHKESVYTLGAVGHLARHDTQTGKCLWLVDTVKEWKATRPIWGFSAPIRYWEGKLIVPLGLKDGGTLVAVDLETGKKIWQGGKDSAGYGWPIAIKLKGQTQFIYWSPENILGFDPTDGKVLWSHPYKVKYGVSIATPIFHDGIAYVAGYWHGSRAVAPEFGNKHPRLVWETEDALCGLMAQPLYRDGVAYLMDRRTGVNAFEFKTGKILWKAANQHEPKDRNPQATMVWVGQTKRVLLLNSLGELILTEFSAKGHKEISRMQIIGKTWAHPAYSGDSVFARSDREIIRVRLPIVR
jgi:outer membrane protein assembly factor BamB